MMRDLPLATFAYPEIRESGIRHYAAAFPIVDFEVIEPGIKEGVGVVLEEVFFHDRTLWVVIEKTYEVVPNHFWADVYVFGEGRN